VNSGRGIRISKGRFEAFSDGVFAIAITLLVLGFQPPKLAIISEASVTSSLLAMWPQYVVYAVTFTNVGIMWFNHYALFHDARYVTYAALIANLALLMLISFLQFIMMLLGQDGLLASLVFFYSLIMLLISFCYGVLYYVVKLGPDEHGSVIGYFLSRTAWNTLGPIVYAAAMVLALVKPIASVILIALIAGFYMLPSTVRSVLSTANSAGGSHEPM
jgi:uncharacterized membrane protein